MICSPIVAASVIASGFKAARQASAVYQLAALGKFQLVIINLFHLFHLRCVFKK
jgi:hypothetical protein